MKKALLALGAAGAVALGMYSAQGLSTPNSVGHPPFWHTTTPRWCAEDMPCWIGSAADGRSDAVSMRDWTRQLKIGQDDLQTVWVYVGHHNDQPLSIEKGQVTALHHCHRGECTTHVPGLLAEVFVRASDFPNLPHHKH